MLRLPVFGTARPTTLDEAVAALAAPGALLVAGGTDLLPNLKHRLHQPTALVSLDAIEELRQVTETDAMISIGAGVTLTDVSENELIRQQFPSLAKAAGLVASPLLRNMGTLGGNVNLDTRCRYVNQTDFWRSAIGGCLKSGGDVCHVVPGGKSCVAAMSSDTVPVLISLGAELLQVGPEGARRVAVADYYQTDGISHTRRLPGEITAAIEIPRSSAPTRAAYAKWTIRKSIDFPLVSCAMRFTLDADSVDGTVTDAAVCLGVLAAKPKLLANKTLIGHSLASDALSDALAALVEKQGKTLPNVPYDHDYRRKILPVHARRALADLIARG